MTFKLSNRVKYARQHVKIVGFNNAAFKRALNVIQDVAYLLVTAVPAGQMEPWVPEIESDELGVSLVANCRYFTLGRDIRPEARMEFDQFVPKDPAGFREGDIVQVGFAVIAYKTKSHNEMAKYTCKLVLRTLTLLVPSMTKRMV
ncbi:hypothetical protein B0H14DRAFT_2595681 [Mycena olivaceomarginata]|nr:hypothetical protein B0H14DRAFT_2595681 [Mycena olivaceomarginata]